MPTEFQAFLSESGLVKGNKLLIGKPLDGGISSDIWRIDLPTGPICIKRALSTLRVTADWHAPIERNRYEGYVLRRR